tara:strand:- start:178 stop:960 length:783 start_codon:yes stop_codon:yes gene_type:complete
MSKSHFPIDLGVLTAIRQLAASNSTIVELGSGNGTNRLVSEYTVYSIEDDEKWVGYCEGSNYIHAPLINLDDSEEPIRWYDPAILKKSLPESYDLVLIDGPAGKKGRSGLLSNLDLFRTDVPFVIDDTLRDHECQVAREMAYLLNRPLYMFWNFSVICPNPLTVEQVSRIQRAALQVLDSEDLPYLRSYFTEPTPIVEMNMGEWSDKIAEQNQHRLHVASLEAKNRKLQSLESSISLRIGLLLTSPLRFVSRLFTRKKLE